MLEWWNENGPPVYASVAGYLGLVKPRGSTPGITSKKKPPESGNLNELARMFESSGGMIQ